MFTSRCDKKALLQIISRSRWFDGLVVVILECSLNCSDLSSGFSQVPAKLD